VRFVHGVAYACMAAMSDLLEIVEEGGDCGQYDPSPESEGDPNLSPITSKCTTSGRIKVHHLEAWFL